MSAETGRKLAGRPFVIVEQGNEWFKIAVAEKVRGKPSISRLFLERIDKLGAEPAEAIGKIFKQNKLSRMPVVLCLPRQAINIRMLELPSTEPGEIADMVDLQIGKQTPYSKEEIVSDYRATGNVKEGYTNVVLAIVQKILVRQRYQLLDDAGIEVDHVSASTEGLLNWHYSVAGAGTAATAFLDVDSYYTDFMAFAGGVPVFSRSVLTGANELVHDFSKWREKLGREIQRSIESCQAETPGSAPQKMIVTGAAGCIKELAQYLQGLLGIPVESRDSLSSMARAPEVIGAEASSSGMVSLTALTGFALQPESVELNLMPDSVGVRKGLEKRAMGLTWFGILMMASLVCFSIYAMSKYTVKKSHLSEMEEQYRKTEAVEKRTARMKEIVRLVVERQDLTFSTLNILREIHARTPPNLHFDNVDVDTEKEQIVLTGAAVNRGDISGLIKNLEQSPLFKDAKEEGATVANRQTQRFTFKVVCALEVKK